jgi:choline transport protein
MSEEVRDASRSVPKAMIAVYIINFCLVFPAVVTFSYHIVSIDDALADPTLYPVVYVLRQSMSPAWMTVILTIMLCLLVCSNMTYLAAVTRDIWAFARDQGLPFSNWISMVDRKRRIPTNAVMLTSFLSICLSLIYIGSPVAFYAITSLLTVALLQCYCLSIGCLLWRRITHPETLPPAKFSLGKFGIPINIAAVVYALWCFFWAFWPTATPVTAAGFNWASVIFISVLIGATIHFLLVARKKYVGPVALMKSRKVQYSEAKVAVSAATS